MTKRTGLITKVPSRQFQRTRWQTKGPEPAPPAAAWGGLVLLYQLPFTSCTDVIEQMQTGGDPAVID